MILTNGKPCRAKMGAIQDGSPTIQNKWELYKMGTLPYKTNRSYIRWEPYHAKVGIINDCVETQSFFIHKIKLS